MRNIFVFAFIVLLLSACGETRFEKELRAAKDNLLQQEFAEASTHIEISLIEEPTNKDALALKEKIDTQLAKDKRTSSIKELGDLRDKINGYRNAFNDTFDNVTPEEAQVGLNELQVLVAEVSKLHNFYGEDKVFSSAAAYLETSEQYLEQAYQAIIDNVEEPLVYKDTGSKYDKFLAEQNSNDSNLRAKNLVVYFDSGLEDFEKTFRELK